MRTAVGLCRDTGVGTYDFDVLFCVRYRNKHRVVRAARRKRSKRICKRDFAHCGHTRGHTYHISLCNTHVEEPVGMSLFESFRRVAAHKVGFENDDAVVGIGDFA